MKRYLCTWFMNIYLMRSYHLCPYLHPLYKCMQIIRKFGIAKSVYWNRFIGTYNINFMYVICICMPYIKNMWHVCTVHNTCNSRTRFIVSILNSSIIQLHGHCKYWHSIMSPTATRSVLSPLSIPSFCFMGTDFFSGSCLICLEFSSKH